MIIWINCKISNTRHKQTRDYKVPERGNLPTEERFDVARYSFASYVPLEPFISKIIFSLVLDDCCAGREQEMEDWINGLFPKDKTMIIWRRYNNAMEWREIQPVIDSIDDDLLWMQGVEDHPFIGSIRELPLPIT